MSKIQLNVADDSSSASVVLPMDDIVYRVVKSCGSRYAISWRAARNRLTGYGFSRETALQDLLERESNG